MKALNGADDLGKKRSMEIFRDGGARSIFGVGVRFRPSSTASSSSSPHSSSCSSSCSSFYSPQYSSPSSFPRLAGTWLKVGFSRALPLVVVLFVLWAGSPVAAELHPGLKARACKSNQMVILGAVELYNMNSSRKMSSLDFPALTASESWLREVPECPAQGTYSSRGDLSVDGRIFCSVHGTTEECQAFEDAYQEKQTRHLYQVLAVLGFGVIGFLAFLIFGRSRRPKAQSE